MNEIIKNKIQDSIHVKTQLLSNDNAINKIKNITSKIIEVYNKKGKVFLCGNGGSAADAQHLAAELVGTMYLTRDSLNAEALTTNTSTITAISNDMNFNYIFSRQLENTGTEKDILIGLSTSGESQNVINAIDTAKELGMYTVGLTGKKKNPVASKSHTYIRVPSNDTARIQEAHILIGHIICELVEKELFNR